MMDLLKHKQTTRSRNKDSTGKGKNGEKREPTSHNPAMDIEDLIEDECIFDSQVCKRGGVVSRPPPRSTDDPTLELGRAEGQKTIKMAKPSMPVGNYLEGLIVEQPRGVEETPLQKWDDAESKLREQLISIRNNLTEMKSQTVSQKNVSRVLTLGILKINEAVDVAMHELQRMRKLRKKEETSDRKTLCKVVETPQTRRNTVCQIPSPNNVPIVEPKRNEAETWAVVARRKRVQNDGRAKGRPNRAEIVVRGTVRPNPGPRRGAVLVKPAEGKTYSEIVRSMKKKMEGSSFKDKVHAIRKTKDGAVLVQLEREEDQSEFQKALQSVIGHAGRIKDLTSKVTLEFLDLDCDTAADEVAAAISKVLGVNAQRNVHVFGENSRGQNLAVCEFDRNEATKLIEKGRIKIGWVNCRVRQRIRVQRCHRCLGYGHLKAECKGPDRHDCCWRCGNKGHVGKDCKSPPACFLCAKPDNRHMPGTGSCVAFRAALAKLKRKTPKCL